MLSRLQDAETGARLPAHRSGPPISRPYDATLAHLGPDLDALKAEIADEPRQSAALARLRVIADERQKVLQESIDLYNSGKRDEAAAPARLDHAKALMDSARSIVAFPMRAEQRPPPDGTHRRRAQTGRRCPDPACCRSSWR